MKLYINRLLPALGLLGLGLAGCQPDIEAPTASAGSADFSRYIAVGNSLTAGFSDDGLYREGQLSSYPSILASQFAQVGGGSFAQPLFTEAQASGSGYLKLSGFDAAGSPVTTRVPGTAGRGSGGAITPPYTKFTDPINNLGVPGIRMSDIQTAGYGSLLGNAYFERITPDAQAGQTYLQRVQATVAAIKPTFFTEWLGNNDVLGFATAGAASNSLTRTDTFALKTNRILNALVSGGAKGVVVTIPDVTGIPFFTTVGPSFKAKLVKGSVPGIVIMTGALPGGPTSANRRVIPTADIRDASGGRQLLTLTSSAFLGLFNQPTALPWQYLYSLSPQPQSPAGYAAFLAAYGIDTTKPFGTDPQNPIPSAFVLDDLEQAQVLTATTAFNNSLVSAANARNLAVFDANFFFKSVALYGYATDAANNSASFLSGNLFSLDGVHPTPRGYAVLANEMLKVINTKYGSTFSGVSANGYRGVVFP